MKTKHLVELPGDMSTLPAPPVPAGLDLRHFDCMHLNTDLLLRASIWDDGCEIVALSLRLWCEAWREVPCASIPNDDAWVKKRCGFAGKPARWAAVRQPLGRRWVLCSDGRLYHLQIAETALKAAAKSRAGKRGAKAKWGDKPLETNNTGDATACGKPNGKANGKSDDIIYGKPDGTRHGKTDAEKGRDTPSPLPPPSPRPGQGGADAPPAGPTAEPDRVDIVHQGVTLSIDRNGICDLIDLPDDCVMPELTGPDAKRLRAEALGQTPTSPAKPPEPRDDFDPERDRPAFMRAENRTNLTPAEKIA